ncbi:hypothetical protein L596_002170 [Steinernema carpocapsae]|uniref:Uncharacterized protein n=1 Tax=Steinernema carpocapsae TaxID=34508 RepID=A0A4U8UR33_STECR|nr:hypothetical protein L596_002170 [Steinernema carpocapsae]
MHSKLCAFVRWSKLIHIGWVVAIFALSSKTTSIVLAAEVKAFYCFVQAFTVSSVLPTRVRFPHFITTGSVLQHL